MAIAVAGHFGNPVGLTTVAGNVGLSLTTANALTVCAVFHLALPVHAGADRSLLGPAPDAAHIHGETGLDGPDHPAHDRAPASDDAVGYIVETVRENPGTWLVPVGPLTNVALALRAAPDLVDHLGGISFMGGARTDGNVTPAAEFNFWADPEAAAEVMACGHPDMRMAGLQLTDQVQVDDAYLERVAAIDTDRARWTHGLLDALLVNVARERGRRSSALHDPLAVLALVAPELIVSERYPVSVETAEGPDRGRSVVAPAGTELAGSSLVSVGMEANGAKILDMLIEVLTDG